MPRLESASRAGETVGSANERQFLVVYVGDQRYATALDQVREVVDSRPCLPVPNALPYVDGIVDLRGRILTVLDLSSLLNDQAPKRPCRVTLVVETDDGSIGLNVEDVQGVVTLSAEQIMFESGHSGEGRSTAWGVVRLDEHLVTLIDVGELVARTPVLHA